VPAAKQDRSTLASRVALTLNDGGGRLVMAARDARTIAGMLDNHDRPATARFVRRSGERGERLGGYLTRADEASVQRASATVAAVAGGLAVVRRVQKSKP